MTSFRHCEASEKPWQPKNLIRGKFFGSVLFERVYFGGIAI